MNPLFIFDLDGTIVDSLPDICSAVNKASSLLKLKEVPLEEVRSTVGFGFLHTVTTCMMRRTKDLMAVEGAAQDSLAHYLAQPVTESRLYSGMHDLLTELAEKAYGLAVLSNKDHALVEQVCATLLPDIPFFAIEGYKPSAPRKPDPSVLYQIIAKHSTQSRTIAETNKNDHIIYNINNKYKKYKNYCVDYPIYMVGDSHADLETARNAKIQFLGALWGYYDAEDEYEKKQEFKTPEALGLWITKELTDE